MKNLSIHRLTLEMELRTAIAQSRVNARRAIRAVLTYARANPFTTTGSKWREFIASLGFESKDNISLIREIKGADQEHFITIARAFMSGALKPSAIRDLYREFFPEPKRGTGESLSMN